jgi:beta-xylosidase
LLRAARMLRAVLAALFLLLPMAVPVQPAEGAPVVLSSGGYSGDFPDPSVLKVGATYYAYSTNTGGSLLPVLTSTDLVTWTRRGDGLAQPASWGASLGPDRADHELWAPAVFSWQGRYIAFYALRQHVTPRRTCIAVATSSSPLGPFVDRTTRPVVCDSDPLGSIDPQPYVDPRTHLPYLTWKSEGQRGVTPTRLWAQRLDAAGTGLLPGAPRRMLLQTAMAWEQPIIENPSMIRYGGQWWLFYSANGWESPRYAVGYARCDSPVGPCRRASTGPLLKSTTTRLGPGGASAFFDASGRLRLAYHYWPAPATSYAAGGTRRLATARLLLDRTGHLGFG